MLPTAEKNASNGQTLGVRQQSIRPGKQRQFYHILSQKLCRRGEFESKYTAFDLQTKKNYELFFPDERPATAKRKKQLNYEKRGR